MSPILRNACTLLLLGFVASGCEDIAPPSEPPPQALVEVGRDFDPTTAGTIQGQVRWEGAIPNPAPFHAPVSPGVEHSGGARRDWPNPNAPQIDPQSKAVAGAVVFLRGVETSHARPWDHPPVQVELRDYRIRIRQGDAEQRCGFVRRGDTVTLVSRQEVFHSLQVRGAAFFSRALPDIDQPSTQRFDRAGVVELASGCGHFWMRGHLIVADHPYYTRTDNAGRFTLAQVPPGSYELMCWMPNWREAGHELDAETALVCRLAFRPPIEVVQSVRLEPRQTRIVSFTVAAERFGQ
jgi:hypothetical protein